MDSASKGVELVAREGEASRDELPVLTVIVPVFNEVSSLEMILKRVAESEYSKQIIVVDDGSTDGSAEEIARLENPPEVEALYHDKNRGKGAAIRTALEHAVGKFTIIQDADLEYDPDDYPKLIKPLLADEADVVYGSRYLNAASGFAGRARFDWGVKLLNVVVRVLYGVKVTDEATCYKAFSTRALQSMDLECERFEFCPEVTAKTCLLKLRLKEVPISYSPRSTLEGKKIRLKDGIEALKTLWKYRRWKASKPVQSTQQADASTLPART